jgi:hypothetical protein
MEKLGIWAVIIGGILLFRLLRWLLRGDGKAASRAKGMARMNAAAERILAERGHAPARQSGKERSAAKQATGQRKRSRKPGAGMAKLQPSRGSAIRLSTPVTSGASVVQRRR